MTSEQIVSLDCIVRRYPEVIAAEADKDLVMINIASGSYYGVSDVAREIWEAIERPRKVCELIDDLCAIYDIDRKSCEEQTLSFLDQLSAENLLLMNDEPSS